MNTVVKKLFRTPEEFADKTITISGWIRTIRVSKNFGFVELNDGSFFKNLQIQSVLLTKSPISSTKWVDLSTNLGFEL